MGRLAAARRDVDVELRSSAVRRYCSPALFSLHRALVPRLHEHAHGDMLDVGCGTMPYEHTVRDRVSRYDGVDVEARIPGVAFIADAQDLSPIGDASYDTVLCSEVLEHVPYPRRALAEIQRVLRCDGTVILTVPYLSRLHEEPYDFYRYTVHGLKQLLGESGFDVVDIATTGSLFAFLGHQLSTIVLGATWKVPGARQLAVALNALLVTIPCYLLDRSRRLQSKFPLGYVAVARKRDTRATP